MGNTNCSNCCTQEDPNNMELNDQTNKTQGLKRPDDLHKENVNQSHQFYGDQAQNNSVAQA
jgi:hypothetical protein